MLKCIKTHDSRIVSDHKYDLDSFFVWIKANKGQFLSTGMNSVHFDSHLELYTDLMSIKKSKNEY